MQDLRWRFSVQMEFALFVSFCTIFDWFTAQCAPTCLCNGGKSALGGLRRKHSLSWTRKKVQWIWKIVWGRLIPPDRSVGSDSAVATSSKRIEFNPLAHSAKTPYNCPLKVCTSVQGGLKAFWRGRVGCPKWKMKIFSRVHFNISQMGNLIYQQKTS